jgi:hypothetical protein
LMHCPLLLCCCVLRCCLRLSFAVSFGRLSLVSLWPKTGRTHQLRKHMAYIGA